MGVQPTVGHVQDLVILNPETRLDMVKHVPKIPFIELEEFNILCCDNGVNVKFLQVTSTGRVK